MTVTANPDGDTTLSVPTRLFGQLEIHPDACITFPEGIPGFGGEQRFVLLPAASDGLYWLQSVDEPGLAFLLADPFPRVPGYEVDVPDQGADHEVAVLAVVTLPADRSGPATMNLQAPLCINLTTRTGWQQIDPQAKWSLRTPLELGRQGD